ncbi:hypothetical protein D3C81_971270 [compost metagenome]
MNALEHPHSLELTSAQLRKVELLNAFLRSHRFLQWEEENAKQKITSPELANRYFSVHLSGVKDRERFMTAFLDRKNQIIETKVISEGSVGEAHVYPRNILKAALNCDCSSIILAHNHPSGIPNPSPEDVMLTQALVTIFEPLQIKVLDHIIIGGTNFVSLASLGQMPRAAEASPSYNVLKRNVREFDALFQIEPIPDPEVAEQDGDEWEA